MSSTITTTIEKPKKNAFYPNYNQLIDSTCAIQDRQIEGLSHAVNNIVNFLDGKEKNIICDLNISLEVSKVMTNVYNRIS